MKKKKNKKVDKDINLWVKDANSNLVRIKFEQKYRSAYIKKFGADLIFKSDFDKWIKDFNY